MDIVAQIIEASDKGNYDLVKSLVNEFMKGVQ